MAAVEFIIAAEMTEVQNPMKTLNSLIIQEHMETFVVDDVLIAADTTRYGNPLDKVCFPKQQRKHHERHIHPELAAAAGDSSPCHMLTEPSAKESNGDVKTCELSTSEDAAAGMMQVDGKPTDVDFIRMSPHNMEEHGRKRGPASRAKTPEATQKKTRDVICFQRSPRLDRRRQLFQQSETEPHFYIPDDEDCLPGPSKTGEEEEENVKPRRNLKAKSSSGPREAQRNKSRSLLTLEDMEEADPEKAKRGAKGGQTTWSKPKSFFTALIHSPFTKRSRVAK